MEKINGRQKMAIREGIGSNGGPQLSDRRLIKLFQGSGPVVTIKALKPGDAPEILGTVNLLTKEVSANSPLMAEALGKIVEYWGE